MDDPSEPAAFIAPEPEDLAPLFPGYEIHDLIATGGMGAVYRAVRKSLDRTVALKILPREFSNDAAFRMGFETEAKAMARLNHPNLIGVYDFGEADGMLYIIMEYVHGKSLHHSARGCAIDPVEVVRLVSEICSALAHAHENGVLHRDIKPSNILLDPNAVAKIGDFGLAGPIGRTIGENEVIYGTPGYTAPEVMEAPDSVDHRADIYSVGVLLHELLTGRMPEDDPRPASVIAGCDVRFDRIIRRATAPLPADRHVDVAEIARELQGITASPAVPVRRSGTDRASGPLSGPAMSVLPVRRSSKVAPVLMSSVIAAAGYGAFAYFTTKPAEIRVSPVVEISRAVESVPPDPPDPPPSVPEAAVSAPLDATDIAALRRKVGERVRVRGYVVNQGVNNPRTIRYLNFSEPYQKSISVALFASDAPEPVTEGRLREFVGKTVTFEGVVEDHMGNLQVRVGDLNSLEIGEPTFQGLEYALWVKPELYRWIPGKDGTVAGTTGKNLFTDAFRIGGLPFSAEFRLFVADRGWLGWTPCDGKESTGVGRRLEAIQFRFPNGMTSDKRLFGRVYLGGVGWQKTVAIEHLTVLGTIDLSRGLEAIQLMLGDAGDSVQSIDTDFDSLLPAESAPVPKVAGTPPAEPGLGRWIWSNTSRQFSILPDGVLLQSRRAGRWTSLNPGQSPRTYELNWGNAVDTLTVSDDGNLLIGHSGIGEKLFGSRVDGASQSRTGGEIFPEPLAGAAVAGLMDRTPPEGIPPTARFYQGKWYHVYHERCGWKAARQKCVSAGGQLVVLPDAATQDFVRSLAKGQILWLGATDEVTEGRWLWSDGSEMKFKLFAPGQPDNGGRSEHALGMYPDGRWNDGPDNWSDVVGYVCEWKDGSVAASDIESGFRMWTTADGVYKVEARIVGRKPDGSEVTLQKRDRSQVPVPTKRLTPADREVVRKWRAGGQETEVNVRND